MRTPLPLSTSLVLALLTAIPALGQTAASRTESTGAWKTTLTTNFRIYHRNAALAQRVARACELARRDAIRYWFPNQADDPWKPRCEVFVCANQSDFKLEGRASVGGAGQAAVVASGSEILYRRIVLRASDQDLLTVTVPHEVAHVAIGSRFAGETLPAWIDEGMATFSEPLPQRRSHQAICQRGLSGRASISLAEIVSSAGYPRRHQAAEFYAGSFVVCDYLLQRSGKATFIEFVRRLRDSDTRTALREVYGIQGVSDLKTVVASYLDGLPAQ